MEMQNVKNENWKKNSSRQHLRSQYGDVLVYDMLVFASTSVAVSCPVPVTSQRALPYT